MLGEVLQNEWMKFRRRRRVLWGIAGIIVVVALITGAVYAGNQNEVTASVYNLRHSPGAPTSGPVRSVNEAENQVNQWVNVYSLRMARHESLPPLAPLLRIEERLHRLELAHPVAGAIPGVLDSTQEILLLKFSMTHHLVLQPGEPFGMSPPGLVRTAFTSTWVILIGILVLLLAGDGFAFETASGTWNSLFLDPVPRKTLVLGKALFAGMVTVSVILLTAALLWGVGRVVFGGGPEWAIQNVHYAGYLVHPSAGSSTAPYLVTIIRHASDIHFQTMRAAAVDSVLLSVVPLMAVVSFALWLGYLLPSGLGSGLLALVFMGGPVLAAQALQGQDWLGYLPGFYLPFGKVLTGDAFGLIWPTVVSGMLVSGLWAAVIWYGATWRVLRKEW